MSKIFSFFDLIVIAGIIQGLIYTGLIAFKSPNTKTQKTLIILILTMVLLCFKIVLHTTGLWQNHFFRYFPLAIDTLMQPVIYLYACALTHKNLTKRIKRMHFLLPALFLIHGLIVYFATVFEADPFIKDKIAEKLYFNNLKWIEDIFAIISSLVYWVLSYLQVEKYRKWLFANNSDSNDPELGWLKNLLITSAILILILTLASLPSNILHIPNYGFAFTSLFYVYLAFLIYFFTIKGHQELQFSSTLKNINLPNNDFLEPAHEESIVAQDQLLPTKEIPYQEIKLAIDNALIIEKLYLEPTLNLKQLSSAISFPIAQVSATINTCYDQNFRNLINSFRVEEVKKRLDDPKFSHLTLIGIALDCGFNSEASFYRIFRKIDGNSPKNYQLKDKN